MLVLANVAAPTVEQARKLTELVRGGTGLLIFTGGKVDTGLYNERLFRSGEPLLPVALKAQLDSTFRGLVIEPGRPSPLEKLMELRASALERVPIRQIMTVDEPPPDLGAVRVLARWNDAARSPAILQRVVGEGNVLLWTTTADRAGNDWPIEPSFVLAIREAVRGSSRPTSFAQTVMAGERTRRVVHSSQQIANIRLTPPNNAEPKSLTAVKFEDKSSGDTTPASAIDLPDTRRAGLYRLAWEEGPLGTQQDLFASNPDPREIPLDRLDAATLKGIFAPLAVTVTVAKGDGTDVPSTTGREIWHELAWGLMGLLLLEPIVASWWAARNEPPKSRSPSPWWPFMTRIWQTFLGIDARSSGSSASGGTTRLELTALPGGSLALGLAILALAALVLLWWLPAREKKDLSRTKRAVLVGIRALVLLAVATMLIEPVLISSHRETIPAHLAVIVDDSESMRFADPYTDDTKANQFAAALKLQSEKGKSPVERLRGTPRIDLIKSALEPQMPALGRGRDVFLYDLESASKTGPSGRAKGRKLDQIDPKRSVSPLGDALRGVIAAHRGRPVAGIVLVSDGRSNAGEDPIRVAETAAGLNIPIYAVAAGGDEGPRNVRLAEIEVSPVVFAKDPMTLAVVAEARGLKDAEATLVLEQRVNAGEWEPLATQRIALGEDGALKRTTFRIVPKVVGQYDYRARIEDAGPELTTDDNQTTAAVRVVRQQIRVLMIAGAPSPEVQFLRNALQRDQQVEFAAWLQHADPGYRQPGDRPISRLPNDADELGKYDALILIDPDMRSLGPQWPELITNFVGKDGGGLIFLPGELYSQQLFESEGGAGEDSTGASWTKILPVVREPGLFRTEAEVRLTTQNTYALDLTPEGRGDPIFEFHPDPIRNRAVLASLPGMYWSFPVTRARPGATVLARHGDPRMQNQYGRHVLLASQLYGPGRTVFIGFDSTYRWRYLAEDYFDGFWARLVDRVGRNKALGGRFPFQVHLGKSAYRVGDQVVVGVRYTEAAAVAEASGLAAELEIEGQPPDPITFERSAEDPALLTATFPAERAGAYTLRITPATGVDAGATTRVSTTTFRVEPPRREVDEPALNRALLTDLARLTGGRTFEVAELGRLDESIPIREVTRTLEDRDELWDAPILFAIIILGLTAEWILRKMFRMV